MGDWAFNSQPTQHQRLAVLFAYRGPTICTPMAHHNANVILLTGKNGNILFVHKTENEEKISAFHRIYDCNVRLLLTYY